MYNPISIPVIRQALNWHGLRTTSINRIDQIKKPNGTVITSYQIVCTHEQIRQFVGARTFKKSKLGKLGIAVQGCFCNDIHVFSTIHDTSTELFHIYINTTFKKRD